MQIKTSDKLSNLWLPLWIVGSAFGQQPKEKVNARVLPENNRVPLFFREPWRMLRAMRFRLRATDALAIVAAAAAVVAVWLVADAPVTAWAERIQSDSVEDAIRITNRFGGGMNPAMVVGFFLLAGVAYRHRRWIEYAAAMTVAGLGAGVLGQLIKLVVGRTRPELWLGPFHHARAAASSFPSGHTVGAFALAGVLLFLSPSALLPTSSLPRPPDCSLPGSSLAE